MSDGENVGGPIHKATTRSTVHKFRKENINIPDDLDMGEMGMDRKDRKKGITCKLHHKTDPRFLQECVGGCGKTGRKHGAMECSNIGVRIGTYNTVKLEKGERLWAVRS